MGLILIATLAHINHSTSSTLLNSAAKLAALSWDPENLKKLSLNAYLQVFATKMPYLQIFATKMPYLQVFATKIALLNYITKPSFCEKKNCAFELHDKTQFWL